MADEVQSQNPNVKQAPKVPQTRTSLEQILLGTPPKLSDVTNRQNAQRVLVITSVAKIDDDLLKLLQVYMVTPNDTEDFLNEGGPAGSLRLRAKLCFRVGLISLDLYQLIKTLSEIRNDCSHKPDKLNIFGEQSVIARLANHWSRLNPELFEPKTTDAEERFKAICSFVSIYLNVTTNGLNGGMQHKIEVLFKEK